MAFQRRWSAAKWSIATVSLPARCQADWCAAAAAHQRNHVGAHRLAIASRPYRMLAYGYQSSFLRMGFEARNIALAETSRDHGGKSHG
jgi:hypothetical protein